MSVGSRISPELQMGDEGIFFLARQAGEDVLQLLGGQQGFIPAEIVPDHAWDLGDLWISRQRKVPVLFARRSFCPRQSRSSGRH